MPGLISICARFVGSVEVVLKFIKLIINDCFDFEDEINSVDFYSCLRYSFGSLKETLKMLPINFSCFIYYFFLFKIILFFNYSWHTVLC